MKTTLAIATIIALSACKAEVKVDARIQNAPAKEQCVEIRTLNNAPQAVFTAQGKAWLAERLYSPEQVAQYDARFFRPEAPGCYDQLLHATTLSQDKIPPAVANAYDKRFTVWDIRTLYFRSGDEPAVLPELANRYKEFYPREIEILATKKLSPEEANECEEKLGRSCILLLEDTPWSAVRGYDHKKTSVQDVKELYNGKVPPKAANRFLALGYSLQGSDIVTLYNAHIPPETAEEYLRITKKYPVRMSGDTIAYFVNNDISSAEVQAQARNVAIAEKLGWPN
jgi:hypothetical protein